MTQNDMSVALQETRNLLEDGELTLQIEEISESIQYLQASLPRVREIAAMLIDVLRRGRRLYMIGNGGSALQAQHFAAELVGHYRTDHKPLPACALSADGGILTSIANDYDFTNVFSRQLQAYAASGDVLVVFSTSGNSANLLKALETAGEIGMVRLGLAGNSGGAMRDLCEYNLFMPARDTARIQEAHLMLVHLLSEFLDRAFAQP